MAERPGRLGLHPALSPAPLRLGHGRFSLAARVVLLTCTGIDDAFHARETVEFYNALFNAQIPAELHIYGRGGHANGISPRNGIPFGTWQYRFVDWITDLGMMNGVK